ncbi:hypothetical protein QUB10_25530 [Microcoleus sp. B5-D4]|uniref:hypothetical protein n=1 Tax=unclassified Microcoleus TaxID=2642155 RepID=UPI002FCE74B7
MSDDKSAIQVADELFQEAYKEVEAKNYSAALQLCQAALAIYQKIGDLSGVAYTLANIADICRLSLESLLPELEESNLPISGDSNFRGEPSPPPPPLSRSGDSNFRRATPQVSEPPPTPTPRRSRSGDSNFRRAAPQVSEPPPTPTPSP